jgi:orotate phosphoribosyltransferase
MELPIAAAPVFAPAAGPEVLAPCRWRGAESVGRYGCSSPKLSVRGGVTAAQCAGCYCRDHGPVMNPVPRRPAGASALLRARLARVPCVHLGAPAGEDRPCLGCGQQGKTAAVHRCGLHGLCTPQNGPADGAPWCLRCDDYAPVTPAAPRYEWVSTARLVTDAVTLAGMLPADIGGVVGLPRSGMLPAAVIATHLHLPLYELTPQGPRRLGGAVPSRAAGVSGAGRFAVVDDTVYAGTAMRKARALLPGASFAAVYARPEAAGVVDYSARLLPSPHLLEWNLLNSARVTGSAAGPAFGAGVAADFDGVICHDAESGGVPGSPFLAPRAWTLPLVVTGRAESHRGETEAWMRRHGVRWGRLEMLPDDVPLTAENAARHKARHYLASGCGFFIESDPEQARLILAYSGRPVICPREGRVYQAGEAPAATVGRPQGMLTDAEAVRLAELAAGRTVLELGSWDGEGSTVTMARVATRLWSCDWHRGDAHTGPADTLGKLDATLRREGLRDKAVLLVGRFADVLPALRDRLFDVVYIDGAHDLASARPDTREALRLVAPGGVIVWHDADQADVAEAIREAAGAAGLTVTRGPDRLAVARVPAAAGAGSQPDGTPR